MEQIDLRHPQGSTEIIPRVIHYCWFGGKPLPASARRCIASWRRYMPGYDIVEWNERNFNVDSIPFTAQAYEAGKYAFVSDYARFKVLYDHGGVYFDTDVELVAPIDDIVERGAFMGCEKPAWSDEFHESGVAPGLGMGAPAGMPLLLTMLDLYSTLSFREPDGSLNCRTVGEYTTSILNGMGLKATDSIQEVAGCHIYPREYFNPKDYETGRITITPLTRSIHHYAASWISARARYGNIVNRFLIRHIGLERSRRLVAFYYRYLYRRK